RRPPGQRRWRAWRRRRRKDPADQARHQARGRLSQAARARGHQDDAADREPVTRHRVQKGSERARVSELCGFASTMEGNLLSEEDQWRKLPLVADTARKVWTNA